MRRRNRYLLHIWGYIVPTLPFSLEPLSHCWLLTVSIFLDLTLITTLRYLLLLLCYLVTFLLCFLLPCYRGVWKSRKPESGIGTGMGTGTGTGTGNSNGTGTAMWRGTDTRTGISFTLNYFNSNSIYTKNKNTTLVSCSPPNLFIIRQREGRKSRKLNK